MKKSVLALILSGLSISVFAQDINNYSYNDLSYMGHNQISEETGKEFLYRFVFKKSKEDTIDDLNSKFEKYYNDNPNYIIKYRRELFGGYVSVSVSTSETIDDTIEYLNNLDLNYKFEVDVVLSTQMVEGEPRYSEQLFMRSQDDIIGANNVKELIDNTVNMPLKQADGKIGDDGLFSKRVNVAIIDTGYLIHNEMNGFNIVDQYKFSTVFEDLGNSHRFGDRGFDPNQDQPNDPSVSRGTNAQDLRSYTAIVEIDDGDPDTDNHLFVYEVENCSSGHGLATSSIISAPINNIGFAGVANVNLLFAKVMDSECRDENKPIGADPTRPYTTGLLSDVADAVVWASGEKVGGAEAPRYPADIINISLGSGVSSSYDCPDYMQAAIDRAINNGSIVVVSAGNDHRDSARVTPSNCKGVISLASNDQTGYKSYFSNYNAPFVAFSTLGEYVPFASGDGLDDQTTIKIGDGTSFSAAIFSGIGALLKYSYPTLDYKTMRDIVAETSTVHPDTAYCFQGNCGSGIVDANAALEYINVQVGYNRESQYYFNQSMTCDDKIKYRAMEEIFSYKDICNMYKIVVNNTNEEVGDYYRVIKKPKSNHRWVYNSRDETNNIEVVRDKFKVRSGDVNAQKTISVDIVNDDFDDGFDYAVMFCKNNDPNNPDDDICHPPMVVDFSIAKAARPLHCDYQ